jgi:hypothetical protein
MPDPSPTTAAIVRAFDDRYEVLGPFDDNWQELCLAAALRVATDQEKLGPDHWEGLRPDDYERGWNAALRKISRIAAELEA